jgi:hypothetical protein
MKRFVLICLLLSSITVIARAQEACPCVPLEKKWVVDACADWTCALDAFMASGGDRYVVTVPAGTNDGRWIVVRKVASGAYIEPADAPFRIEAFDTVSTASDRFGAIPADHAPILMSSPDGKMLVISLKEAGPVDRRRPAKP